MSDESTRREVPGEPASDRSRPAGAGSAGDAVTGFRITAFALGGLAALDIANGYGRLGESPWMAWSLMIVGALAAAIGLVHGVRPDLVRRLYGLDPAEGRHVLALALQATVAYLVFGHGVIVSTVGVLEIVISTGEHPAAGGLTAAAVMNGVVVNLVLFLVAAVSWPLLVRRDGLRETLALRGNVGKAVLAGIGVLIGYIVAVGAIGVTLQQLGFGTPENPQADAIRAVMTLPLAFLVSASAAIGEEAYFRGLLQRKLGLWPQAILFGLVHASFLTPLQVILPFAMGLVFGWARDRWGIWAPVTTHFLIDMIALTAGLYDGTLDLAWLAPG